MLQINGTFALLPPRTPLQARETWPLGEHNQSVTLVAGHRTVGFTRTVRHER